MGRHVSNPPGSIKSIQRGIISVVAEDNSADATVTSVDTAKSVLTNLGDYAAFSGTGADSASNGMGALSLENATTVRFTRNKATIYAAYCNYQLVEYY